MAVRETATSVWAPDILETALLVLLKRHSGHGYGLIGQVKELGVEIGELTRLYRILRNLETAGFVASRWDTSARGRGPARKVYSLTRSGHRHLRQRIQRLQANAAVMQRIDAQYVQYTGGGA